MKKIIASIAFICYLAVTTGILVNFHYCMNRLSALEFFVTENKSCPKCGMTIDKSGGCCRDEVRIIKMEVDQKASSNLVFEFTLWPVANQVPSQFIAGLFNNVEGPARYKNHSPPLLGAQEIYLKNCVFRI